MAELAAAPRPRPRASPRACQSPSAFRSPSASPSARAAAAARRAGLSVLDAVQLPVLLLLVSLALPLLNLLRGLAAGGDAGPFPRPFPRPGKARGRRRGLAAAALAVAAVLAGWAVGPAHGLAARTLLPPALQEEPLRELVRGLVEGGALRDLAASGVLGNLGPLLRPVAGAGDVVAGMLPKMSVGEAFDRVYASGAVAKVAGSLSSGLRNTLAPDVARDSRFRALREDYEAVTSMADLLGMMGEQGPEDEEAARAMRALAHGALHLHAAPGGAPAAFSAPLAVCLANASAAAYEPEPALRGWLGGLGLEPAAVVAPAAPKALAPRVAVSVDRAQHAVVVAYEGTPYIYQDYLRGLLGWIADLDNALAPLAPSRVLKENLDPARAALLGQARAFHGFYAEFLATRDAMLAAVDAAAADHAAAGRGPPHVFVTGHSQGASHAAHAALELAFGRRRGRDWASLTLYTFATPQLGNAALYRLLDAPGVLDDGAHFLALHDFIPYLPRVQQSPAAPLLPRTPADRLPALRNTVVAVPETGVVVTLGPGEALPPFVAVPENLGMTAFNYHSANGMYLPLGRALAGAPAARGCAMSPAVLNDGWATRRCADTCAGALRPPRGGVGAAAATGPGPAAAAAAAAAKPTVRLLVEVSAGRCRRGQTFGPSGADSLWVSDGCRGTFRFTPAGGGVRDGVTIPCADPERHFLPVEYEQTVERRRWWCLWMCKRGEADQQGLYHCRARASPYDAARSFVLDRLATDRRAWAWNDAGEVRAAAAAEAPRKPAGRWDAVLAGP